MRIAGQKLAVTASMGLAYYEGHGGSAQALVERAKGAGRNTFAATVV